MAPAPTRTTRRQPREAATWRAQLAALHYVPKFIQLMWQTHRGYTVAMAVLRLFRAFIPLATLWVGKLILVRAVQGIITLGSLTFLAGSFARCRDLLQHLLLGASGICQQCLYLKDLFDFFETQPSISSPPGAPAVPRPIRHGFVFEDVGFRYPGRDAWAVRHVNFRLHADERLAFVGENGAGKTTLIKLLARLYDPTEGRILLDGVDLCDYDLPSVHRAIGVIFQDFIRYDLRFDENIGIGAIDELQLYLNQLDHGEPINGVRAQNRGQPGNAAVPAPIAAAAEKSLATSLLPGFSAGYGQMLGRRFESGIDLSGGEWQKIALARA